MEVPNQAQGGYHYANKMNAGMQGPASLYAQDALKKMAQETSVGNDSVSGDYDDDFIESSHVTPQGPPIHTNHNNNDYNNTYSQNNNNNQRTNYHSNYHNNNKAGPLGTLLEIPPSNNSLEKKNVEQWSKDLYESMITSLAFLEFPQQFGVLRIFFFFFVFLFFGICG